MLNTLIASAPRPRKLKKGWITSLIVHGTLIGAAVAVTGRVVMPKAEKPEEHRVVFAEAPPPPPKPEPAPAKVHVAPPPPARVVHTVYRAPQPKPAAPPKAAAVPLLAPPKVPSSLPAVDLKVPSVGDVVAPKIAEPALSASRDLAGGSVDDKAGTGSGSGKGLSSGDAGKAFTDDQVERAVEPLGGAVTPRYPESMRSAGIEGTVRVRFIVGANGRVESGSVQVLDTPNEAFSDAVRRALSGTRYRPAQVGGRSVRQLVEQSFTFKLDR